MKRLLEHPLIVGNVVRAVLGVGTLAGLALADAQTEAIVGAALAVLAAYAAITAKEQAVVTPMKKVEKLGQELGGNAVKLVDRITEGFHL